MRANFMIIIGLITIVGCQSPHPKVLISNNGSQDLPTLVQLPIPEGLQKESDLVLQDPNGALQIPIQLIDDNQGVFLVPPDIEGGTPFDLMAANQASSATFSAEESGEEVLLKMDGQPLLSYHLSMDCPGEELPKYYCRNGYIHPLRTPSGVVITDDFPAGHTHQHAFFFAWTRTKFRGDTIDFWNQQGETGTVRHKELISTTSGPVFTGFESSLEHVSLKHGVILEEQWSVQCSNFGAFNVLDISSNQRNITEDTLFLLNYHYGGLGIRGHRSWNSEEKELFKAPAQFLTSEGKTKIEANHTKPHWTAMYGEIENGVHGLAVFDHPDNKFHPQSIRVHPSMPYFCQAPIAEAGFHIAPGETHTSRYRIVTYDGEPNATKLQQLWDDYASPPAVEVK